MAAPEPNPEANAGKRSALLFWVILGIVFVTLVAFLILRPVPSGAKLDSDPSASHK